MMTDHKCLYKGPICKFKGNAMYQSMSGPLAVNNSIACVTDGTSPDPAIRSLADFTPKMGRKINLGYTLHINASLKVLVNPRPSQVARGLFVGSIIPHSRVACV